ncbi:hypothetical protein [Micromonospora chersina]|uniref:hypothetical protein n=1 Tax=Micromonospora chersina TaxID=47854 RepID=UPI001112C978|nr:hypothetical protein [Micromonospora chersina]
MSGNGRTLKLSSVPAPVGVPLCGPVAVSVAVDSNPPGGGFCCNTAAMLVWVGRAAALLVALALAVVGVLFVYASWNAWDGLPPDGPPLGDASRTYETLIALFGLSLLAGGIWIVVRVARGVRQRTA